MFESILFLATTLILLVSLMMVPKNKAKLNGVTAALATVTSIIAFDSLMAGIINLFGVPVNITSFSALNLGMAAVAFFYIWKKKKCQQYFVKWQDVAVIGAMAAVTVAIGYARFGARWDVFAYESDDSVRHYAHALELVNTGKISSQRFVMYILNMIFIQVFDPFKGELFRYTSFIKTDLFVFFMMGSMFWVLIRKYITGNFAMITGFFLTFMYWLGYPFNSFLHGFEYLGAGILMITFLLWVLQIMEFDKVPVWLNVCLLTLANFGVFVAYTQFAPAVLIGEVIYLFLFYKKRKLILSWSTFAIVLAGIAVPGFLCVCYVVPQYLADMLPIILLGIAAVAALVLVVWLGLFIQARIIKKTIGETIKIDKILWIVLGAVAVVILAFAAYKYVYLGMIVRFTADKGMASDGNIYREPYANFLWLFFPLSMHIADCIKKKKNDAAIWMLAGTICFSIWLIRCIITGSIGSYYFYKMHYIIWLFLYVAVFKYISAVTGEARSQMRVYLAVVCGLFFIFAAGIDKKLVAAHEWMWTDNVGTTVFGIYDYNLELMENGGNVNEEMQVIYNVVRGLTLEDADMAVPFFGTDYRYIKDYFYYLSGQDPYEVPQNLNDPKAPVEDILGELKSLGITRIFVENNYESAYEEEFSTLRTEFETEYGSILILE